MADKWLLQDGSGSWQLQDASGYWILQQQTVALAGSFRHAARQRSLSMTLAYAAAPFRTAARALGAILLTTVALTGTMRAAPRATGDLKTIPALVGTLRAAPRAYGEATAKLVLVGTLRSSVRASGQLQSVVALAGTLRASPRETGLLGIKLNLAGTLRESERLRTAGMVLAYGAAPTRVAPRAYAFLISPTVVQVSGTLRSSVRLMGAPMGPKVQLASRLRVAPRGRSTSFVLAYGAAPVRAAPRATGSVTVSAPTGMQGTVRAAPRIPGTELTTTFSAAELVVAPRMFGAPFRNVAFLSGTLRASPRIRGAELRVDLQVLTGRMRMAPRALGAALTSQHTAAAVVVAPRILGASLQLIESLSGTLRAAPRLRGAELHTFPADLTGRLVVAPRLLGADLQILAVTPLHSTARGASARIVGQLTVTPLGKVLLAGVNRGSPPILVAASVAPAAGRPPYGVSVADPIGATIGFALGHMPLYDGTYFYDGTLLYGDYAIGFEPAHGVVLGGNLKVTLT